MTYFEKESRALKEEGKTIAEIAEILKVNTSRIRRALQGDYVVRIVATRPPADSTFIDFLQGLQEAQLISIHRESDDSICFDIHSPNTDSEPWADKVAAYMETRGFNSVKAPRWPDADS